MWVDEPRVKVGVFGRPSQVHKLPDVLHDAFEKWADVIAPPRIEFTAYATDEQLLDHVLILGETFARGTWIEAAGCAVSVDRAAGAFVGELIERLAFTVWKPGRIETASHARLHLNGTRTIDVERWLGEPLLPREWRFTPFSRRRILTWVQGVDALDREPVWVPATLVAAGAAGRGEAICELTSTGLAAAPTARAARDHGLLEVVERDALMVAWMTGHPFRRLEPTLAAWPEVAKVDSAFGWETELLCAKTVTGDDVHVVLSRHGAMTIYGIGSSVSDDPVESAEHALAEALQIRFRLYLSGARRIDRIRTFYDRLTYYSIAERFEHLDALVPPPGSEVEPGASWSARPGPTGDGLVRRLSELGMNVVVVDLLGGDNESSLPSVSRVLVPGLQHMEAGQSHGRVARERIPLAKLQQHPHPFP